MAENFDIKKEANKLEQFLMENDLATSTEISSVKATELFLKNQGSDDSRYVHYTNALVELYLDSGELKQKYIDYSRKN